MDGKLYENIEITGPDNLINNINVPITTKAVTLKKSTNPILRGTVLGINTTSGIAYPVDSTKQDGTQEADCILAYDVVPADGDVVAVAYSSGQFNRKALIFGGNDTAEKHEKNLRELGIYLKDNI